MVRIPTPGGSFILVRMNFVSAEVPVLIGVDVMVDEKPIGTEVLNKL